MSLKGFQHDFFLTILWRRLSHVNSVFDSTATVNSSVALLVLSRVDDDLVIYMATIAPQRLDRQMEYLR